MTVLPDNDILRKVKLVSETTRNPEYGENSRRMSGGKVCNSAAKPSDLDARRRDQLLTIRMDKLVRSGHLKLLNYSSVFPYFQLTTFGLQAISETKP